MLDLILPEFYESKDLGETWLEAGVHPAFSSELVSFTAIFEGLKVAVETAAIEECAIYCTL